MKSVKARKQRKAYFNAPLHRKQKNISSHLEENLLLKYDRRSVPLITGDTVKVLRGPFKGHENKVAQVHVKDYRVEVEGVTITKADGKKIAKPLHPSNLLITKLNLTDKWRRKNLEIRVSAETKKEIEAEANEQLKEVERERKLREEEQRAAEAEAEQTEEEKISTGETAEEQLGEEKQSDKPKKEKATPEKKGKSSPKKGDETKEKKSSSNTKVALDSAPTSPSKKTTDTSVPNTKKSSSTVPKKKENKEESS